MFEMTSEADNKYIILVYDWAYKIETGEEVYARTPERAERLRKAGIKLTPVYTVEKNSAYVSRDEALFQAFWKGFNAAGHLEGVGDADETYVRELWEKNKND